MLMITMKASDAYKIKKSNSEVVVFPSTPETQRLLKQFLSLNLSLKKLSDATLWKKYDPKKYETHTKALVELLDSLDRISKEINKDVRELNSKNNTKRNNKK